MIRILALGLLVVTAGCASQAATPNFVNGRYFMGGDDSCKHYRMLSSDRIMCVDSAGRDTGYRDAMTDQQLMMWQQNRAYEQMQMQQLNQQMQQASQSFQQQQYQNLQQSQQWSAPAVPSYQQNNNTVRCISAGIYTNCRY